MNKVAFCSSKEVVPKGNNVDIQQNMLFPTGTTTCKIYNASNNFDATQLKFSDMKNVFFMAAILAAFCATTKVSAQTTGGGGTSGGSNDTEFHMPHRGKQTSSVPQVSYNPKSTELNVSFPTNGQGGKVEIYRNGALVVDTKAPAGANLSYVLSNYGRGNYIVVVSSGKTVIYYGCYNVK